MKTARAIQELLAMPDDQRWLGPFRLVRPLGRGSHASVWLGRETYGGTELREAAVKLFAPAATGSSNESAWRQHITDEARALCRVEHPNVVRFFTLSESADRAVLALVMEYVPGNSLGQRLDRDGRLDEEVAVGVGIAVASALVAIHAVGLVHKDIKPLNIVATHDSYKLIDFGIAGGERTAPVDVIDDLPLDLKGTNARNLPGGGSAEGTIGYIDPACMADGSPATPASDLYALGVVLFECLAGRLPAVMAQGGGLNADVLTGRARAPRVRDEVTLRSAALATLVDRLLDPDPGQRPASAEVLVSTLHAVRGELRGRPTAPPPEKDGPFRGLSPFEHEHRAAYFGRRAETAVVTEMLKTRAVVSLTGPSGSGKSSLARAGVGAAVADGALGEWPPAWDVVTLRPGPAPAAALRSALSALPGMQSGTSLGDALRRRVRAEARGVLLIVDQLEELVTLAPDDERAAASELIAELLGTPTPGLRVVTTIRQDFLDVVLGLPGLGRALLGSLFLVAPLAPDAWADVVDEALALYGYEFESPSLRRALLAEISGAESSMPIAQFGLSRMWQKRDREKRRITELSYVAMKGLSGAFERHADRALQAASGGDRDAERVAKNVLLGLVTARETCAVRSAEELFELGPKATVARVLEAFVDAGLLRRERGGYALSHDLLVRHWGRLRSWMVVLRRDRATLDDLERAAGDWVSSDDAGLLWQGERLTRGERLRAERTLPLSPAAELFLRASRWRARRYVLYLALVAVALVGVTAAGTWSVATSRAELHRPGPTRPGETPATIDR